MKAIKIKGVDETIYEHVTKCGLKIYIWPYLLSEEISLSLTVKYGSVDTKFKVGNKKYQVPNGMAHFLEHIKFYEKGNASAHEYFYKIGSYVNAYTTYDHTSYEVVCNSKIKENINHLLFFVLNPYFTSKMVSKEKSIIIEEAKMTLDNPYAVGYKKLMESLYKYDNRKYLVTGEKEDIKKISLENVQNVFNAYYHPKNMFLTITGKVNPHEVVKIVDEYFANTQINKYQKPVNETEKEPNEIVSKFDEINAGVTKEKLFMGIKISKRVFKNYDDLHIRILIKMIMDINIGVTSDFNEYLITNNLVDDISYMVNIVNNHVIIIIESSTSFPKEVSKAIKEKLKSLEFDASSFKRKNKSYIAGSILGYEDAQTVNDNIRNNIIKYGKIIYDIQDVYKNLKVSDGNYIISKFKNYEVCDVILKPNKKSE